MRKAVFGAVFALMSLVLAPLALAQSPEAAAVVVADTGFRPDVNGFAFPNYGSEFPETQCAMLGDADCKTFPATNLTTAEMRRMFGDQVCARIGTGDCVLKPAAAQWMEQNNAAMANGHCEGMAVLSQLFYGGQIDLQSFGAEVASELPIEDNEPLQREIAYWFATQGIIWEKQIVASAAEQVAFLIEAYNRNPSELYRIGVMKADGTGGHAITAWAVVDMGGGLYRIMVYDNNFPGDYRYIEVDASTNTWQYEASINPQVEPDLYTGDNNNPMFLAPDTPRLGIQPCVFCSTLASVREPEPKVPAPEQLFNQVWMEGDAQLLVIDDEGRRLGYVEGKFVDEIPGARVKRMYTRDATPVFELPVGLGITVVIDGSSIQSPTSAEAGGEGGAAQGNLTDVVMIGPGYYIGVEGISMDPGQVDHLRLDGSGQMIAYRTDYAESPVIIVGLEQEKADFELEVHGQNIKPGSETMVYFDKTENALAISSTSDEPGDFSITLSRIDETDTRSFGTDPESPLTLESGDILFFYFGEWEGQGDNLMIGVDKGGDGTIDDYANMADAQP